VKAWALHKYASRLEYLNKSLTERDFLLDRFSVADGLSCDRAQLDQRRRRSTSANIPP